MLFPLTAILQLINFTALYFFSLLINAVILLLNCLVLVLYIHFLSLRCLFSLLKHYLELFVSPDESRGYLGFSTVTPPPQRFPFGRDNFKNILVRTFKFGMWVYIGNATNAIVL